VSSTYTDCWQPRPATEAFQFDVPTFIPLLLGKRHVVSGLTLDGIEICQLSRICNEQKQELKGLTLVQPKTKEVTSNLKEIGGITGIEVEQYSKGTSLSYTADLESFARESKKTDLALWLAVSDWKNPSVFFYPSKPENLEQILLALDQELYSLVIMHHEHEWLSKLSKSDPPTLAALFSKFSIKQTRAPTVGEGKFSMCYFIFQKKS
jgi:hypothetical protein